MNASAGDLIWGRHAVIEALAGSPDRVKKLFVAAGADEEVEQMAKAAQVVVMRRSRKELGEMVGPGRTHQGVAALMESFIYAELDDLLGAEQPLLIALDGVTDPQNLGSIVRSVHVLGGHGIILPKDRTAPVTPAVVRASAGATAHTPIAQVTNLVRSLEQMKKQGLWVVGTVATAPGPADPAPWTFDFREGTVLVIGSEGTGLRRLVAAACDHMVCIPVATAGPSKVGSLNAAVAASVLLYEALRQRSEPTAED